MAFYDLNLKFQSQFKEPTEAQLLALTELSKQTEYSCLVLNYSILPNTPVLPLPFQAYRRVTVRSDFQQVLSNTSWLAEFDVVAAAPRTEEEFCYCCTEGDCDLIKLNLHTHLNFVLAPQLLGQAIDRGVMLELVYAPALRDINARREFIRNGTVLIQATKGRNLVLSSGCADYMDQRGPWDVINLGCLLGMPVDQAKAAISQNPEQVLQHAKARKLAQASALPLNE